MYERWLKFRQDLGFEVVPTTGGPRHLAGWRSSCVEASDLVSIPRAELDSHGDKALDAIGDHRIHATMST